MRHTKREIILDMLWNNKGRPMFGLEMIHAARGGLKRGTVYVVLNQMETSGLVESWKESRETGNPGIPRRMYRLTDKGCRLLALLKDYRSLNI